MAVFDITVTARVTDVDRDRAVIQLSQMLRAVVREDDAMLANGGSVQVNVQEAKDEI